MYSPKAEYNVVMTLNVVVIMSDCAAVSSINASGSCSEPSSSVTLGSRDTLESENMNSSCTDNSTSNNNASLCAVDEKLDDGLSPVTSVSVLSDKDPSAAALSLGERTTSIGNEPLEGTTETDLAAAASSSATDGQNVYHVKWIKFRGSQTPIVMQNQNGPCPLLAIVNVLLLQSKIKLSSGADLVASDQLMAYIADWIFDNVPKVCTNELFILNMYMVLYLVPYLFFMITAFGIKQLSGTEKNFFYKQLDVKVQLQEK